MFTWGEGQVCHMHHGMGHIIGYPIDIGPGGLNPPLSHPTGMLSCLFNLVSVLASLESA